MATLNFTTTFLIDNIFDLKVPCPEGVVNPERGFFDIFAQVDSDDCSA